MIGLSQRNVLLGALLGLVLVVVLTLATEYYSCMIAAQQDHDCFGAVGEEMLCVDMEQKGAWVFGGCRYCKVCGYDYEVFHLNRTRPP